MPALVDSPTAQPQVSPKIRAMNLKRQLRMYLDRREMTAAQLARKSGVSKQVLSMWLSGRSPRDVEQVKRVADVFETSIDNLLFGNGPEGQRTVAEQSIDALLGDQWVSGVFEVKLRRIKK